MAQVFSEQRCESKSLQRPVERRGSERYEALKRLIDIGAALAGLVVLAPFLGAVAVAIRMTMGWPVLLHQARSGHKGKPFTLLKFRTMMDARDAQGRLLPDGERLTPLGRLLRRMSIDELPQLWNVLKGDMSLVGPRPLLVAYMSRYTPRQARRHEVKPGITGWAQINGRNALAWERRFELDVWYIENRSFFVDTRILLATILQVVNRDRASEAEVAIMDEFKGYFSGV